MVKLVGLVGGEDDKGSGETRECASRRQVSSTRVR